MRDIKAIRGDFFAHGVPFELLEEFESAIRKPAPIPSPQIGADALVRDASDFANEIEAKVCNGSWRHVDLANRIEMYVESRTTALRAQLADERKENDELDAECSRRQIAIYALEAELAEARARITNTTGNCNDGAIPAQQLCPAPDATALRETIETLRQARDKIQNHLNEIYSAGGVEYIGLGSTLDRIDRAIAALLRSEPREEPRLVNDPPQPAIECVIIAGEYYPGAPIGKVELRVPGWVFEAGLVRMTKTVAVQFAEPQGEGSR